MKKLPFVLFALTSLLLSACSQSTEDLFAESIKEGAEAENTEISQETADCTASKTLPLLNEDTLKEKINSGNDYDIEDEGLLKDPNDIDEFTKLTFNCMTDEELATATEIDAETLNCQFEAAGGKEGYVDALLESEENPEKLIEVISAC